MPTGPLEYWQPGDDERQLRVFISHRFGRDQELYDEVIRSLYKEGFTVQDISLNEGQKMMGPRGGKAPDLKVMAEVAARIYTADVLIAPSRVGSSLSEWVTWEVQLASVGYGVPILFVNERDQKKKTSLVSQVKELDLPHAVCDPNTQIIVSSAIRLIGGRPTWAMRQSETDSAIRFRGPPQVARDSVLKKFPFQARLSSVTIPPSPRKHGFRWPFTKHGT